MFSVLYSYPYSCIITSQSETSVLQIPSLDFEHSHSSIGGRFTTVEGMLSEVKKQLQRANPFLGDSVQQSNLTKFLEKFSEVNLMIHREH